MCSSDLDRLERRIAVLEKAFADIVERHENSLRDRGSAFAAVDESVVGMRRRLEASEQRYVQTIDDLKKALMDMHVRLNGLHSASPAQAAALEAAPSEVAPPTPELPPMDPPAEAALADEPPMQMQETEIQTGTGEEEGVPLENVSYLANARRAAMSTQSEDAEAMKPAMAERPQAERPRSRARLVAFACLAPITVVAASVFVLNRHNVTAQPAPSVQVKVVPLPPPPQVQSQLPIDPTPSQTASSGPFEKVIAAAEAGDVNAQRDAGLKYLAGDGVLIDQSEAARWLMRAAYQGEPTAEYWLGTLYARGHGVPADAFQANHWYEAAAKQGNARAMQSLGVAHFEGWGVEKNIAEAARWFRQAADLGSLDAAFNLAVLYERGTGVPRSFVDAYKWYAIAASQGDSEAQMRVAAVAKLLSPADLAQAQQAVANFKPQQSANQAANPAPSATQSSGG